METIIAIVFVIIMIIIDNDKHIFINFIENIRKMFKSNNIEHFKNKIHPLPKINKCEKKVLIFNKIEFSSRKWVNFGSRYTKQDTNILTKLCIESAFLNLKDNYDIFVINENNLDYLIPEYIQDIKKCNDPYIYMNLIKYCILFKFGGLWLNNDTIILNKLYISNVYRKNLIIFSTNKDGKTYDDSIIMTNPNNNLIYKMLLFIKKDINSFQNSNWYSNSINKQFNKLLLGNSDVIYMPYVLNKYNDKYITMSNITDLYKGNIKELNKYVFFKIDIEKIEKSKVNKYLLNMTRIDLLESNMFISKLFFYSFNKT